MKKLNSQYRPRFGLVKYDVSGGVAVRTWIASTSRPWMQTSAVILSPRLMHQYTQSPAQASIYTVSEATAAADPNNDRWGTDHTCYVCVNLAVF